MLGKMYVVCSMYRGLMHVVQVDVSVNTTTGTVVDTEVSILEVATGRMLEEGIRQGLPLQMHSIIHVRLLHNPVDEIPLVAVVFSEDGVDYRT